ncbi:unnamed protein product, partial [Rotaria sp. Silwood2]
LCYTRLKDTSTSHHKLWCSQHNQRIYNIYKRRPYRYRDLIVRLVGNNNEVFVSCCSLSSS